MSRVRTRIIALMGEKQRQEGRIISATVVAEEVGLSRTTIYNWINDDIRRFDEPTLKKLCDYFNCEVGDLIYLDRTPEAQ